MALLFRPPVRNTLPRTVPGRHPGNSLMRWFAPGARGVNVFIVGGAVTENDPGAGLADVTFHGGHEHYITVSQQAMLTAAGYGVNITTVPDPVPDETLWGYGGGSYGGDYYGGVGIRSWTSDEYTDIYEDVY